MFRRKKCVEKLIDFEHPRQRPGLLRTIAFRPVRAKALKLQAIYKAVALTGRVFKIRIKI